jgi:hypothetical protein
MYWLRRQLIIELFFVSSPFFVVFRSNHLLARARPNPPEPTYPDTRRLNSGRPPAAAYAQDDTRATRCYLRRLCAGLCFFSVRRPLKLGAFLRATTRTPRPRRPGGGLSGTTDSSLTRARACGLARALGARAGSMTNGPVRPVFHGRVYRRHATSSFVKPRTCDARVRLRALACSSSISFPFFLLIIR